MTLSDINVSRNQCIYNEFIAMCGSVTIDGVWIGDWIY
jgi:hypothetical protein